MYDLHATLKTEGGKMRLELVVECAYDYFLLGTL